jgi:hypothetical protein
VVLTKSQKSASVVREKSSKPLHSSLSVTESGVYITRDPKNLSRSRMSAERSTLKVKKLLEDRSISVEGKT